jgi:hypothetical protein
MYIPYLYKKGRLLTQTSFMHFKSTFMLSDNFISYHKLFNSHVRNSQISKSGTDAMSLKDSNQF